MTSKERMMIALRRGRPDRMPITIHQWQGYHLRTVMGGCDQVEAFRRVGLDASVAPWDCHALATTPDWVVTVENLGEQAEGHVTVDRIKTPKGELVQRKARNHYTTFVIEHMLKDQRDVDLFLRYWPGWILDKQKLAGWYDRTGDSGIVRGFVQCAHQPGTWQEFCELVGTENAIMWANDDPAFVHHFLQVHNEKKVRYVHEQMRGAKFDLIEHGGGAASSTVISPGMFEEFCLPYDKRVIAALHDAGFLTTYHTCGGMMAILDKIWHNGTDASETLSPPGVGGDIGSNDQRRTVKQRLGKHVALIGGIDQGLLEKPGTIPQIQENVRVCFETFGQGGGYICSASDHFFFAPQENLQAMCDAARECRY